MSYLQDLGLEWLDILDPLQTRKIPSLFETNDTSVSTEKVTDKRILRRSWFATKARLAEKQGYYKDLDGNPMKSSGATIPLLTFDQGIALFKGWAAVGNTVINGLLKIDRPELVDQARKYIARFLAAEVKWLGRAAQTPSGQPMPFDSTVELLRFIDRYAIDLDNIDWSAENIEPDLVAAIQRAGSNALATIVKFGFAVGATSAGLYSYLNSLPNQVRDAAKGTADFIETISSVMKWGAIGFGLYLLWDNVLKPKR